MACLIPENGMIHSVKHAEQDLNTLNLSWTEDGIAPNELGDYPIDIQFEANVSVNLVVSIDDVQYIDGSSVVFQIQNQTSFTVPFDIENESVKKEVQVNLSYFLNPKLSLNYSGDYEATLLIKIVT
jgi:hypothetical protein